MRTTSQHLAKRMQRSAHNMRTADAYPRTEPEPTAVPQNTLGMPSIIGTREAFRALLQQAKRCLQATEGLRAEVALPTLRKIVTLIEKARQQLG